MSTTMTDNHGNTNGTHGGVGHLLRMAKTQCGVSLAFAALRKADGGFAIATFPTLTTDPSWSVEAIDELVRQTWDDPNLSGGTVLVRSGRVLKGMWAGQGHHIKLAAAALSDPEAPEHPWGLLCVAEPVAGHFEQDQLNLLGNLAIRLTSYLRARQQVLEGSPGFEQGARVPVAPIAPEQPPASYEPIVETPVVAEPPVGGAEESAPVALGEPSQFDHLLERPVPQAASDTPTEPGDVAVEIPWGDPRWSDVGHDDDWDFLELDQIDWVEAVTPEPVAEPTQPGVDAEPLQPSVDEDSSDQLNEESGVMLDEPQPTGAAPSSFGTREDGLPPEAASASSASELDALLGPDPETGLASLTTLVGRLSVSLAHVRNNEGTVGLILVEISEQNGTDVLGPITLLAAVGRLTNHVRDRDLVARIGPSLFALLVDLRPGAAQLQTICERTIGALEGMPTASGNLHVRSTLVSATAGSDVAAEELLRQAANQLQGR